MIALWDQTGAAGQVGPPGQPLEQPLDHGVGIRHPLSRRFLDPAFGDPCCGSDSFVLIACLWFVLFAPVLVAITVVFELKPSNISISQDGALRPELERFAAGESRAMFPALCTWLGGLRLLRCVERQTEALLYLVSGSGFGFWMVLG